jgi:hypothetical protein
MLDLGDRPALGGLRPREVGEAITALALRVDWAEALDVARGQQRHAAYVRARWVAAPFFDPPPPAWPPRRPVDGLDLVEPRSHDVAFGIRSHVAA